MGLSSIIHKAGHIAAFTLNNPFGIGTLSFKQVVVPIIGMNLVHKYGWEHWEHLPRNTNG